MAKLSRNQIIAILLLIILAIQVVPIFSSLGAVANLLLFLIALYLLVKG